MIGHLVQGGGDLSWTDYGVIFPVNNLESWAKSHAYVPTAIELDETIRVFVAFLSGKKHGRLGYVDVCRHDPRQIRGYSKSPVIEDAPEGYFDANGVTPLGIVREQDTMRLYYAGWEVVPDPLVRYRLQTGLLLGDPVKSYFKRYGVSPVIATRQVEENVRTGGCILKLPDGYHCWLATQKGSTSHMGKVLPVYDLEYLHSEDGLVWPEAQTNVFSHKPNEILGYGRSAIWLNEKHEFEGLFSVRNWDGNYTDIMYATSLDGIVWSSLSRSGMAFCAEMTCDGQTSVSFPNIIQQENRKLMFYNGNDFGREGLRLAIWSD